MTESRNLAARMGQWSAHHRKTSIFGWLAFCVAAFVLGTMLGTNKLTVAEAGVRESGRMDKLLDKEFKPPAAERVIIQSPKLTDSDVAFKAVVTDVITRLNARPEVTNLRSPFDDT